jgi:hypothetical protein
MRTATNVTGTRSAVGARPFLVLSWLGLTKALVAKGDPGDLPGPARERVVWPSYGLPECY